MLVKYPAPGFRLAARPANIHNLPCTEGRGADLRGPEKLQKSSAPAQRHGWVLCARVDPAGSPCGPRCWLEPSAVRWHIRGWGHTRWAQQLLCSPVAKRALLFVLEGATISPRRWKRGTTGFEASDARIPHHTQMFLLGALLPGCYGGSLGARGDDGALLCLSTHGVRFGCRKLRAFWSFYILKTTINCSGVINPSDTRFTLCIRQGCNFAKGSLRTAFPALLAAALLRGSHVLQNKGEGYKERRNSSSSGAVFSVLLLCLCFVTSLYFWWKKDWNVFLLMGSWAEGCC